MLGIYLDDHRAGSTLGIELAKRSLRNNRGTTFGTFLEQLLREILEDRRTLEQVLDAVGAPRSRLKAALAVAGERLGRLKLNGQFVGYSPLSRLVEFEALTVGVTGKLALWRALQCVDDERVRRFDLEALAHRAEAQLTGLEQHRLEAARLAFAD